MQMEPQGEGLRVGGLDQVLTANILTAFGHIQAATVDGVESLLPAVMRHIKPMRAGSFLTVDLHRGWATSKSLRLQFAAVEIANHQRRMRGGGAGGVMPFGWAGKIGATVHDQPVAADRQLHR